MVNADVWNGLDDLHKKLKKKELHNHVESALKKIKKKPKPKTECRLSLFEAVSKIAPICQQDPEAAIYKILLRSLRKETKAVTFHDLWYGTGAELPAGELKDALHRMRDKGHIEYVDPLGWRFTETFEGIIKKARQ